MTEGQVQEKWVLVQNNGEFEKTEFELVGSNCSFMFISNNNLFLFSHLWDLSVIRTFSVS